MSESSVQLDILRENVEGDQRMQVGRIGARAVIADSRPLNWMDRGKVSSVYTGLMCCP